jgi:hypothetical protein
MTRSTLVLAAAALLFAAPNAIAQAKPDFSGKWSLITDSAAAPTGGGRGGGGLGESPSIAQDASTLTITRTTQAGEVKSVYNLDGSPSKNTVAMRGGSVEQTSTAKWDANKLVISTTFNMGGSDVTTSMALSLDASGNLVVESTGMGRGGGAPTTTTRKYKKA